MARHRISINKEDRIWDLRSQGYTYDAIARIVNAHPGVMTEVLRRVRRRPPFEQDPVRRGRRSGWLSDSQVEDIRTRRAQGEKLASIAKDYWLDPRTICAITKGRSYTQPEAPFPYNFTNRLSNQQ